MVVEIAEVILLDFLKLLLEGEVVVAPPQINKGFLVVLVVVLVDGTRELLLAVLELLGKEIMEAVAVLLIPPEEAVEQLLLVAQRSIMYRVLVVQD